MGLARSLSTSGGPCRPDKSLTTADVHRRGSFASGLRRLSPCTACAPLLVIPLRLAPPPFEGIQNFCHYFVQYLRHRIERASLNQYSSTAGSINRIHRVPVIEISPKRWRMIDGGGGGRCVSPRLTHRASRSSCVALIYHPY